MVDAYRTGLLDQLFAERGGREQLDVVGRIACEQYALVCASAKTIEKRLDEDGLFTKTGRRRSAFDMLKSISETIDKLREKLPPVIVTSDAETQLTDDELIPRAEAFLQQLKAVRDLRPPPPADATRPVADAAPRPPATPTPHVEPELYAELEPLCQFCQLPPADCDALKGADLATWRTLHHNHASEVERRAEERTAEMRRQVGKPPRF